MAKMICKTKIAIGKYQKWYFALKQWHTKTSSVYYYKQFVKKEGRSNTAINHNIDYSSEFSLSLLLFWYMMMYWWLYDYSQVNV